MKTLEIRESMKDTYDPPKNMTPPSTEYDIKEIFSEWSFVPPNRFSVESINMVENLNMPNEVVVSVLQDIGEGLFSISLTDLNKLSCLMGFAEVDISITLIEPAQAKYTFTCWHPFKVVYKDE